MRTPSTWEPGRDSKSKYRIDPRKERKGNCPPKIVINLLFPIVILHELRFLQSHKKSPSVGFSYSKGNHFLYNHEIFMKQRSSRYLSSHEIILNQASPNPSKCHPLLLPVPSCNPKEHFELLVWKLCCYTL